MNLFKLKENNTSIKQEVIAGLTSFFAISYIVIVNSSILKEAGIPPELSVFSTIFVSVLGCLLMAFMANSPIILTPGMGVNAFFTYTLVGTLGLTWQQALGAVIISSLLFCIIAFTRVSDLLNRAVPDSLKHGITCGIGLFLIFIGMEKGELIKSGKNSIVSMGDLSSPQTLLALFGLAITLILMIKKVQGNMFIGIVITAILGNLFGLRDVVNYDFSFGQLKEYSLLFGQQDFSAFFSPTFLLGVFSLTMILVFESMGLLQGLLPNVTEKQRKKAYQASALTTLLSGFFGTSPTIAAAESAAGIEEGGKTGLTSVVAGGLFLLTTFFISGLAYIPQAALAPVIIITGFLMSKEVRHFDFDDMTEWFPAALIFFMIPLTYSIADGLALGFVSYTFLKVVSGKRRELHPLMYVISALFALYLGIIATLG